MPGSTGLAFNCAFNVAAKRTRYFFRYFKYEIQINVESKSCRVSLKGFTGLSLGCVEKAH